MMMTYACYGDGNLQLDLQEYSHPKIFLHLCIYSATLALTFHKL